jgi:hypothetical protein
LLQHPDRCIAAPPIMYRSPPRVFLGLPRLEKLTRVELERQLADTLGHIEFYIDERAKIEEELSKRG